jgi:serine/threonine protein kinase
LRIADFGVTGQLKEQQKTHTVIGTPFWMAPEVIQEVGHDYKVNYLLHQENKTTIKLKVIFDVKFCDLE